MASRLLNVRLSPEDERLAKQLRARGISLSEVVRHALRDAAKRLDSAAIDPAEFEAEMLRLYPTPPGPSTPRPDTVDRKAVREYIRGKLRTRR
jgi:Arc/MetJ-type ribon-helix-helix transcriptional regulator